MKNVAIVAVMAATSPPLILGLASFWTWQFWLYGLDQMIGKAIEQFGPSPPAPKVWTWAPTSADEADGAANRAIAEVLRASQRARRLKVDLTTATMRTADPS